MYLVFAAIIVFFSVIIGPGIFWLSSNVHVVGIGYFTVTDYSVKASDAVGYYLQVLLAVVIGFLTIKNNGNH